MRGDRWRELAWIMLPAAIVLVLDLGIDAAGARVWDRVKSHIPKGDLRKIMARNRYQLQIDQALLDSMDAQESRDAYEILTERHRRGSVIVTSNRGPDEWLATFADPIRAQSAIDRFANNAFDLVIEGESYRSRLKPALAHTA